MQTLCPQTLQILRDIPRIYRHSMFSAITPGTHIIPHTGPTNKKLRVHLGIMGCDGASIRVGEETRCWQDGKVIIFDDSFEHEVRHEGERQNRFSVQTRLHSALLCFLPRRSTLCPTPASPAPHSPYLPVSRLHNALLAALLICYQEQAPASSLLSTYGTPTSAPMKCGS